MAAIYDPNGEVNLEKLAQIVQQQLPTYSWPLFIRLVKHLDITGTFKLKKFNLQQEGFDPSKISDKLYFLHPKIGTYQILRYVSLLIKSGFLSPHLVHNFNRQRVNYFAELCKIMYIFTF